MQHRKGIVAEPFDSYTTHHLMRTLTDREAWPSGVQRKTPSAPNWCDQIDTHIHQVLHSAAFAHVREKHPGVYGPGPTNMLVPLPIHSPDVTLIRQSMHLRGHTTMNNALQSRVMLFSTQMDHAMHRVTHMLPEPPGRWPLSNQILQILRSKR